MNMFLVIPTSWSFRNTVANVSTPSNTKEVVEWFNNVSSAVKRRTRSLLKYQDSCSRNMWNKCTYEIAIKQRPSNKQVPTRKKMLLETLLYPYHKLSYNHWRKEMESRYKFGIIRWKVVLLAILVPKGLHSHKSATLYVTAILDVSSIQYA